MTSTIKCLLFFSLVALFFSCRNKEENLNSNNEKPVPQFLDSYPQKIDSIVDVTLKSKYDYVKILELKVFHPWVDEKISSNEKLKERRKFIDNKKFVARVKIELENKNTLIWIFVFDKNLDLEWCGKEDYHSNSPDIIS